MGPINPLVVSCPLCHLLHVSLDVSLLLPIPTVNLFGKFWKACFVSYWDNTCDHCCKLCFVNHYCISNGNKELNLKNIPALVQMMVPLSEPMMTILLAYICVAWFKLFNLSCIGKCGPRRVTEERVNGNNTNHSIRLDYLPLYMGKYIYIYI